MKGFADSRLATYPPIATPVIETEVHQRLRAYLREQGHTQWPHHLTMARLVARALRVGRSALMQTDSLAAYQGNHRLSYLMPALLWPEPAILALPAAILETVLRQDIPNLQQCLPVVKAVQAGDRWPDNNFRGLLVTSAQGWLGDRLRAGHKFPAGIPTLIDGAGELERWAREQLSSSLSAKSWEALMLAYPGQQSFIRDMRVRITHAIFQHPANPYGCHLIEEPEKTLLCELYELLESDSGSGRMPKPWPQFWQRFSQPDRLAWSQPDRESGSLVLRCGPSDIQGHLAPVWAQQPVVLMGAALDADTRAERYRDRLGLGEMTCLSFGPDRHHDLVQLYLPDHLPMPNTSHFKAAVLQEIRSLLGARSIADSPTVIVVGDVPLKAQIATILAAEFGSRVQVEGAIAGDGILITGWEYWRSHQANFATPGLLIITTLPIPSLENPLVAGRVATYKRRRQDWFKAYLLPEALSELQHAVAPVRSHPSPNGGVVALLDNRVNYRSYGRHILAALSPAARSSYLDAAWFNLSAPASTHRSSTNR
ncbi:MAG: helicase C-terminal domain-containing protein [Phormidesmis sp.]